MFQNYAREQISQLHSGLGLRNYKISQRYSHIETVPMVSKWTVPRVSIMIIYNSTWLILIQWILVQMSGDNLTK